ncbi:NAD-dependent epimerase/dehydratase family protein [Shewanella psychromarinicola]|uniref:NAD-dependent epimerase/dehydratase family protein n=1 Tax=Shewanella psychromarinicola TaxID=2487742 RepID=A0A3N4EFW6_9GAMM|nr:SDR family oxidoreductase [Shewanella psychromarinicola]AZG35354.1 NAD-dependent epimerase/dehydratase family protein [Shewanella psychromarinicola]MCL1083612.1 SDR family oxidoreductase [Shewanella psychromarinicola]RPA32841.1 NAD-dependent epimerase/dehydratase family protein [Shewanella psychromarinicola]
MALFTVFGGRGFIGSAIVSQLEQDGHAVQVPERGDKRIYKETLGTVIYAAGSGDCENDPVNVVQANLNLLSEIINNSYFEKLVYLSSTRLYLNQYETNEAVDLNISINDNRRLFNLTKIAAEELCLKSKRNFLIIRPSNVYGLAVDSPLFLPSIVRNALLNNNVDMYVTPAYSKDYVYVGDLVSAILKLLDKSITGIVNIASGENTSAKEIANILELQTNCKINWLVKNDVDYFHPIDISKIKSFINYEPVSVVDNLNKMVCDFKLYFDNKNS